jgi:hypothetical protein
MKRGWLVLALAVDLLAGCVAGRSPYASLPANLRDRAEVAEEKDGTAWALSTMLDPRAGPLHNSGYGMTPGEVLRTVVPVAGVALSPVQVVEAGQGRTETEHRYYHNLEPIGGRRSLELARFFRESGKMSPAQYERFLRAALSSSPGPDPAVLGLVPDGLLGPGAVPSGGRWLVHWPDPAGITPGQARLLLEYRVLSPGQLGGYLAWRMTRTGILPLPPASLLTAEALGVLSKDEVDALLTRRFWVIYDWALDDRKRAASLDPWRSLNRPSLAPEEEEMVRRGLEGKPTRE